MTLILLQLGDFQFNAQTAGYNRLAYTRKFNWERVQRFSQPPHLQFSGEGDRTVQLDGAIFPGEGAGYQQIDKIEAMGARGQPFLLVGGTGTVLGYWVIENVSRTDSNLFGNGIPQKQEFSVSLAYYGEAYP